MRRIPRATLPKAAETYLDQRQSRADTKNKNGALNIESDWKAARQTKSLKTVVATLQAMMGPRARCMYCMDSHGADVEHFRPKIAYPQHMYRWPNLLLCCTECGRLKGHQFPTSGRRVLLIDPTYEDPWKHLDFDPDTGNICARFDLRLNDWAVKGVHTVAVLKLDQREALSAGYLQTLRRLTVVVQTALGGGPIDAVHLISKLRDADDHGLLGWCLSDRGQVIPAFRDLRHQYPVVWRQCRGAI